MKLYCSTWRRITLKLMVPVGCEYCGPILCKELVLKIRRVRVQHLFSERWIQLWWIQYFSQGKVAWRTCFWAVNRGLRLRGEGLQRSSIFKLKVNPALHKRPTRCHLGAGETCVKMTRKSSTVRGVGDAALSC